MYNQGLRVRDATITLSLAAFLMALAPTSHVAAQQGVKAAEITFDFDDDSVSREARAVLTETAGRIKAQDQASARVIGHADAPGSESYNLDLGERRALAAAAVLEAAGLPRDRIRVETRGESDPLVPTLSRERANRRVTILRNACASWRGVASGKANNLDFALLAGDAAAMNSALAASGARVGAYMMSAAAVRSCGAAAGYQVGTGAEEPRFEEYARRCICDFDRMQVFAAAD